MRYPTLCLVVLGSSLLSACGKQESAPQASASASPAISASAASKSPFTIMTHVTPADRPAGPLTLDWMKKANLSIDIYTPTAEHAPIASALAQAKGLLGEPTFVGKNTYAWGVVNGDSCAVYQIADKDGKAYSDGVVSSESNGGTNQSFSECLTKLGKTPPKR